MKKTITIISAVCITMMACSKSGGGGTGGGGTPTPTPSPTAKSKSYIRITFSGKTLEARDTIISAGSATNILYPIPFELKSNFSSGPKTYTKYITIANEGGGYLTIGNLKVSLLGMILDSPDNNPLATYPCAGNKITDLTTSTQYTVDTSSKITLTFTNADYSEGTMNMKLITGASSSIPATGTFKIYHK